MSISFDKALGFLPEALEVRNRRAEILASNIANADTPGYKARDIDFQSAIKQAIERTKNEARPSMITTHSGHMAPNGMNTIGGEALYVVPNQPSLDGNTVDSNLEKARFGENAVRYQISMQLLSGKFRGLMTAIRGE